MTLLMIVWCARASMLFHLGAHTETRSSHSYSASTTVHPALAAIAAWAGFHGTALVLVQEPVLTT